MSPHPKSTDVPKQNRGVRLNGNRLQRAAAMTASGMRRYPKEVIASLRRRAGVGPFGLSPLNQATPLADWASHDLAAVWLGHASVLLRIGGPDGLTILTDPVFSERVGVKLGPVTVGVGRLAPVPIPIDQLPAADLVLLSHAHFDHLDRPTLKRLVSDQTAVITARKTSRLIPRGFGRIVELDWSQQIDLPAPDGRSVSISAHRPAHWGARFACDRRRGFNSYLIQSHGRHSTRVLFAGDTAHTHAFDGLGAVDLAIFGIGAYDPWDHAHANPEQVWSMFSRMSASDPARGVLLPMHHSTFKLSEEHVDEPMTRLLAAAGEQAHRVVGRRMGDLWSGLSHATSTIGRLAARVSSAMPTSAAAWLSHLRHHA
ncbi:MAG: MBL fold metallo-hydrolase [Phycisphaeraceae bacterium]|nr:MBL fold metallo-hydrolase [Phycisphaeraceae bacterium]